MDESKLCGDKMRELHTLVPDPAGRSYKERQVDEILFDAYFKLRGINIRGRVPRRDPNEEEGMSEAEIKILRRKIWQDNARIALTAFEDHIVLELLGTAEERANLNVLTILRIIVDEVRRKVQNEPQVPVPVPPARIVHADYPTSAQIRERIIASGQKPSLLFGHFDDGRPVPKRPRPQFNAQGELLPDPDPEFEPRNMQNYGNAGQAAPPNHAQFQGAQLQHQAPPQFHGQQRVQAPAPPRPAHEVLQQFNDQYQNQDPPFFGRVIKVPKHVKLPLPIILPGKNGAPGPAGPAQQDPQQFQGQQRVQAPALFERPVLPAPQQIQGQQRPQFPVVPAQQVPQQFQGAAVNQNQNQNQGQNQDPSFFGRVIIIPKHAKLPPSDLQRIRGQANLQAQNPAQQQMGGPAQIQMRAPDPPQQQMEFPARIQVPAQNPAQQQMGGPAQMQMRAPDPALIQDQARNQGPIPAEQQISLGQYLAEYKAERQRQAQLPIRRIEDIRPVPQLLNGVDQYQNDLRSARYRLAQRQNRMQERLDRFLEEEADLLTSDMEF